MPERLIKLECLSETVLTTANFLKKFKGMDVRSPEACFSKFLRLNRDTLRFLGIEAIPTGCPDASYLLRSSQFVGCCPLYSPKDGTPTAYMEVVPRYGESIVELLPLLHASFSPEYAPALPLACDTPTTPPILMECVNFIKLFLVVERDRPWQKFHVKTLTESMPRSGTDWEYYAAHSFDPHARLVFLNRNNSLSHHHPEWCQLVYVLTLALDQIATYTLQHDISQLVDVGQLSRLRHYALNNQPAFTDELRFHAADPQRIKELKAIGNQILRRNSNLRCAWRVDNEAFFERYCQFLCAKACKQVGVETLSNSRIPITSNKRPAWGLRYLEPDIIMRRGSQCVVADAKYKSHMLNLGTTTETLKIAFRHDLHQLLAYVRLCGATTNVAFLLYPANEYIERTLRVNALFGGSNISVHLLGIPIRKSAIDLAATQLARLAFTEKADGSSAS